MDFPSKCCANHPYCRCVLVGLTEEEKEVRRREATALIRAGAADQKRRRKAFDFTPQDVAYLNAMGIKDPDDVKET